MRLSRALFLRRTALNKHSAEEKNYHFNNGDVVKLYVQLVFTVYVIDNGGAG